jgi:hypothetical protein
MVANKAVESRVNRLEFYRHEGAKAKQENILIMYGCLMQKLNNLIIPISFVKPGEVFFRCVRTVVQQNVSARALDSHLVDSPKPYDLMVPFALESDAFHKYE